MPPQSSPKAVSSPSPSSSSQSSQSSSTINVVLPTTPQPQQLMHNQQQQLPPKQQQLHIQSGLMPQNQQQMSITQNQQQMQQSIVVVSNNNNNQMGADVGAFGLGQDGQQKQQHQIHNVNEMLLGQQIVGQQGNQQQQQMLEVQKRVDSGDTVDSPSSNTNLLNAYCSPSTTSTTITTITTASLMQTISNNLYTSSNTNKPNHNPLNELSQKEKAMVTSVDRVGLSTVPSTTVSPRIRGENLTTPNTNQSANNHHSQSVDECVLNNNNNGRSSVLSTANLASSSFGSGDHTVGNPSNSSGSNHEDRDDLSKQNNRVFEGKTVSGEGVNSVLSISENLQHNTQFLSSGVNSQYYKRLVELKSGSGQDEQFKPGPNISMAANIANTFINIANFGTNSGQDVTKNEIRLAFQQEMNAQHHQPMSSQQNPGNNFNIVVSQPITHFMKNLTIGAAPKSGIFLPAPQFTVQHHGQVFQQAQAIQPQFAIHHHPTNFHPLHHPNASISGPAPNVTVNPNGAFNTNPNATIRAAYTPFRAFSPIHTIQNFGRLTTPHQIQSIQTPVQIQTNPATIQSPILAAQLQTINQIASGQIHNPQQMINPQLLHIQTNPEQVKQKVGQSPINVMQSIFVSTADGQRSNTNPPESPAKVQQGKAAEKVISIKTSDSNSSPLSSAASSPLSTTSSSSNSSSVSPAKRECQTPSPHSSSSSITSHQAISRSVTPQNNDQNIRVLTPSEIMRTLPSIPNQDGHSGCFESLLMDGNSAREEVSGNPRFGQYNPANSLLLIPSSTASSVQLKPKYSVPSSPSTTTTTTTCSSNNASSTPITTTTTTTSSSSIAATSPLLALSITVRNGSRPASVFAIFLHLKAFSR